ncbi:hypothetical protein QOL56_25595, partial [Klebsiella quasipneumoniae]|uniref:hypothetical protein n=1 Tax=Klebsiella quasipneumoniae TaxID=1463165 RepID=UPI0024C21D8D
KLESLPGVRQQANPFYSEAMAGRLGSDLPEEGGGFCVVLGGNINFRDVPTGRFLGKYQGLRFRIGARRLVLLLMGH